MEENRIQNLEVEIQNNEKEISNLKSYIRTLEDSLSNLQSEYSILLNRYNKILSQETGFKNIENQMNNKNKEIFKLKESIQNIKSENEKKINDLALKHEIEINKIKFINETNINKIENANHIEKLNKIMYNKILELENIIDIYEKEEDKRMKKKEVEHEKKQNEIKKKCIDLFKFERDNNKMNNIKEKMNFLQNNELINELEYQSYQIEDLLNQREHLDKIITGYKNDIKIHSEIEKNLAKKNKKYSDFIKILSIRDNDLMNNKNKSKLKSIINEESCNFEKRKNVNLINQTHKLNKSKSLFYMTKSINSQKQLLFLLKEIDNYKSKYNTLKDRLDTIYNKFCNLINLLDECLEKIYNDNIVNVKEMYFNIEDFKNCDLEKLNWEEKYSIILIIIKTILPILNLDKMNNIDITYNNIKNKFCKKNFIFSPTNRNINPYKFFLKKINTLSTKRNKNKTISKYSSLSSNFNGYKTNILFNEQNPFSTRSYSLLKI